MLPRDNTTVLSAQLRAALAEAARPASERWLVSGEELHEVLEGAQLQGTRGRVRRCLCVHGARR